MRRREGAARQMDVTGSKPNCERSDFSQLLPSRKSHKGGS